MGESNFEIQEGMLAKDFEFISEDVLPTNISKDDVYGNPCTCLNECTLEDCTCVSGNCCIPALFDRLNRFLPVVFGIDFDEPVALCSPKCRCSSDVCPFQPASYNKGLSLILKEAADKGLGVFCGKQAIHRGTFIDFYVGEIISASDREHRLSMYDEAKQGHALLCLKEHSDNKNHTITTCRDATVKGNISRFINHDCSGGNLTMVTFRYHGSLISKLGIIASRDILPGEELTMQYGHPNATPNAPPCYCRSKECLGFMPHEN